MADLEPTGERVFDPELGAERDAFPGEVVPPDQEKTLTRLMREGKDEFLKIYNAVSGQLTEEEARAVLKAGNIYAEQKRLEYLEGIKANPGNILINILKPLIVSNSGPLREGLLFLDKRVGELSKDVTKLRSADEIAGKPIQNTSIYIEKSGIDSNVIFYNRSVSYGQNALDTQNNILYQVIKRLGALPSPNIQSYDELVAIIEQSRNQKDSGKPYYYSPDIYSRLSGISNLACNIPGLEGFYIQTGSGLSSNYSEYVFQLAIEGKPGGLAALLDNGQYTPFQTS